MGSSLGSFFSGLGSLGVSIAQAVQIGQGPTAIAGAPGTTYIPATGEIVTSAGQVISSTGQVLGGSSSTLILLIIVAIVAVMFLRK